MYVVQSKPSSTSNKAKLASVRDLFANSCLISRGRQPQGGSGRRTTGQKLVCAVCLVPLSFDGDGLSMATRCANAALAVKES